MDTEIRLYIREHVRPQPVTDAQVKAGYDATVASLGPFEYKPRLIEVTDAATAQRVLAALKSEQDFVVLAGEYSVAPTNANGGEMSTFSEAKDDIRAQLQEQALKRASAQLTGSLFKGAIIRQ